MSEPSAYDSLGGFRTPLGAGMLSGVMAGAFRVLLLISDPYLHAIGLSGLYRYAVFLPAYSFLFLGPAIAQRSWRLCLRAFVWGAAVLLAWYFWNFLLFPRLFPGIYTSPPVWQFGYILDGALMGTILGLGLRRLYGAGPRAAYVALLGAAANVATQLCLWGVKYAVTGDLWGWDTFDELAVHCPITVMFLLIGFVVWVILPTWAIEHRIRMEQRARRRAQAAAVSGNG